MPGYDVVAIPVYETVAIYACIPLAIFLFFAVLTVGPALRGRSRWKSGQPWEHEPVWFAPHPEHEPAAGGHGAPEPADVHDAGTGTSAFGQLGGQPAPGHGAGQQALPAGAGAASGAAPAAPAAPAPHPGAPLGGARGTW